MTPASGLPVSSMRARSRRPSDMPSVASTATTSDVRFDEIRIDRKETRLESMNDQRSVSHALYSSSRHGEPIVRMVGSVRQVGTFWCLSATARRRTE